MKENEALRSWRQLEEIRQRIAQHKARVAEGCAEVGAAEQDREYLLKALEEARLDRINLQVLARRMLRYAPEELASLTRDYLNLKQLRGVPLRVVPKEELPCPLEG